MKRDQTTHPRRVKHRSASVRQHPDPASAARERDSEPQRPDPARPSTARERDSEPRRPDPARPSTARERGPGRPRSSERPSAARRSTLGAKRRIAWHLYEARHDQSEALVWAQHDFESLVDRLAAIGRSATAVLERVESLAHKYRRLGDEAAPVLAATEALWDEAQAAAHAAGLPDDEDEKEIRAAIARLTDRREIRNALAAFERLKRGYPRAAAALS